MQTIADLIDRKRIAKPNTRQLKHEWMAFAYKVWKEYSNDKKDLPNLIKFFRTYQASYRGVLDSAYNFCIDYYGPVPKLKLFYWKFWQIKKSKPSISNQTTEPTLPSN